MEQEGPSFWAEIKKYEDTLERDPNSYCFAPLSELYRKLGMVDDAIIVAKRGCDIHPEYVGGYMALGRAYLEKGMNAESREALEKVVRVTPDNLLAQRILSKIYIDSGEVAAAEKSLKIILSQNPDDSESQLLLQSLIRTSGSISKPLFEPEGERGERGERAIPEIAISGGDLSQWGESDYVIDLDESDIFEEASEVSPQELNEKKSDEVVFAFPEETKDEAEDLFSGEDLEEKDPLTTVTLAELYVSQGFPKQALTILRELLETDPENLELKNRIHAIKQEIDGDEECVREHSSEADSTDQEIIEPEGRQTAGLSSSESGSILRQIQEHEIPDELEDTFSEGSRDDLATIAEEPDATLYPSIPSPAGTDIMSSVNGVLTDENSHPAASAESVIRTLEIWLENIKRRR